MDNFSLFIIFYIIFLIVYLIILFFTPLGKRIRDNYTKEIKKTQDSYKLEKDIKEYKKFMNATGKNNIKDIAIEFGEDRIVVEEKIKRAIEINLMRGYYLCKQTKDILPLNQNIFGNRKSITIKENKSIKIRE